MIPIGNKYFRSTRLPCDRSGTVVTQSRLWPMGLPPSNVG